MGTVIGFVVSMVLFGGYFRVMKRSRLFVVLYSVLMASFEFCAFIFCIDLNWWNVLILPFGTLLITFICFFIAPLSPNNVDVVTDSVMSELPNYYENYDSLKPMGKLHVPYFKQTYDRELYNVLYSFTSSVDDTNSIIKNLLTNVYYPFSSVPKYIIEKHVKWSIDSVALSKPYLRACIKRYPNVYNQVFNIFVCLLDINETATDNICRDFKSVKE